MKLTMTEGLQFVELYNKIKDTSLPIKVAFTLNKIYKEMENDINFYNEKLGEIIQKYGQKDDSGNPVFSSDGTMIEIIPELREECLEKQKEVNSLEIEVPDYSINIDDLEKINLTVSELNPLMSFIQNEN